MSVLMQSRHLLGSGYAEALVYECELIVHTFKLFTVQKVRDGKEP